MDQSQSFSAKLLRAHAKRKKFILSCRKDPNKFAEYCFADTSTGKPIKQAWFHREMLEAFANPELHDIAVVVPRLHGKTSQCEIFVIWALGNNPNLRIKFVCNTDKNAKDRLAAISKHIKTNKKVKEIFPWLEPDNTGEWTQHKLRVKTDDNRVVRDASVEAFGITSGLTGGRSDILFLDDVADKKNSLDSPVLREKVKTTVKDDLLQLNEPDGKTIYTSTPWHTLDLTHEILDNSEWHIIKYEIPEDLTPLWEEKWPKSALKKRKRKIGSRAFDRAFRNIALSADVVQINPDWIQYWDIANPPDIENLVILICYDPSVGKTTGDPTGCAMIGLDLEEMNVYVLNAWHAHITIKYQIQAIKIDAKRWKPEKIGIEKVAFQETLVHQMSDLTFLPIVPVKPQGNKEARLGSVEVMFENMQIFFNPMLNPDKNELKNGDIVSELLQFPLGVNDDMVDALVYALILAREYSFDQAEDSDGVGFDVVGGDTKEKEIDPTIPIINDIYKTDTGTVDNAVFIK
jgi:phage terminase large subunit-like protein